MIDILLFGSGGAERKILHINSPCNLLADTERFYGGEGSYERISLPDTVWSSERGEGIDQMYLVLYVVGVLMC